jgi:hypothetical protein
MGVHVEEGEIMERRQGEEEKRTAKRKGEPTCGKTCRVFRAKACAWLV